MILCPTKLDDITLKNSYRSMFLSGTVAADVPIIIHAGHRPTADRACPLSFVVTSHCGEIPAKHTDGALNYFDRFAEVKITRPGLCEPNLKIPAACLQLCQDYRNVLKGTLKTWDLFDVYVYGDLIELHYRKNDEGDVGTEGIVTLKPVPSLPYYPCFGIPGEGLDGGMRYVWIYTDECEQDGRREHWMRLYTSESPEFAPVAISRTPNADRATIMHYSEVYSPGLVSHLLGDGINRVAL